MNLAALTQQLARDMKASAAKTAVLGLLLLVGLCFWVPPLLKAFAGGTSPTTSSSTQAPADRPPTPASSAATPSPRTASKKAHDSLAISKLLQEHPMLQPAIPEEMPERPFGLNEDLIPLPVLIAEDALAEPPPTVPKQATKPVDQLDGLVLRSTLIGPTRQAALINNRLFQVGQLVPWNNKELRLASVTRKSVTLTDGSHHWQLTLDDSKKDSEP